MTGPAVLSPDHPSAAYVRQTEEFLGVISSRWGPSGGERAHQNGVERDAGQLVISPGPLTTWDRYVLSAFPEF